ncbi:rho GTPase-activating protein 19 isoform X1 [Sitophilus oryzae]|uniref:Rho GTPase-activating protein 19 isoform X1 n=1 Tax=Sitophilus oryzae TaxID=7048 RepID=A0A6J2Y742_SITOR|nr:rho GTPase-activating protein 19 isoform X1 [Sitophilus oryzae]
MHSPENWTDDEDFVEHFKKEHNEQFYVLVKMHLSFLLHMPTEESDVINEKHKLKKWNVVPFGKKSRNRNITEGTFVSNDLLNQVYQLIHFIKGEEKLKTVGIFRRTGSVERQNELKNLLQQGCTINFDENNYTVHDCASVLKGLLAELPEPLTNDTQFPIYCQIMESYDLSDIIHQFKVLQCLQLLFLLLPKEHKDFLRDLFGLLNKVTRYEDANKMSADNLAKLFTPHLLCPRKLSPEMLLKESQALFGLVAFMIKRYKELFKVPGQLMLDFRLHYDQKNALNESVKGAAHTVFTFVDNKLTAKENEENVTETALAQLYAHIQSLPESSKKRKLVKQFNKENGQGTPLQVLRSSVPKNKSFGDSIKKHMFHKKLIKNMKKSGFSQLKSASSEEILNSPPLQRKASRGRLFCHNNDSSSETEDHVKPKRLKEYLGDSAERTRSKSDSDISLGDVPGISGPYLTSTPACRPPLLSYRNDVFTPENENRRSMSPITRSAQRMPRAMQETMMTPRSRKPVLLVSGTNINNLAKMSPNLQPEVMEGTGTICNTPLVLEKGLKRPLERSVASTSFDVTQSQDGFVDTIPDNTRKQFTKSKSDGDLSLNREISKVPKMNKTDSPKSLTTTFKRYLTSRNIEADDSLSDSSFSSRSDDFQSYTELHTDPSNSYKENVSAVNSGNQEYYNENISDSLLYILDGNYPDDVGEGGKELVLKPRQFDKDGKPTVFETSF